MFNGEGLATVFEVRIGAASSKSVTEGAVGIYFGDCPAYIVEHAEYTRRILLFDQVAHDLVVEEFNGSPLNALLHIFLLFQFECQLNEDLLQFFVYIVDTELFETVFLKKKKGC